MFHLVDHQLKLAEAEAKIAYLKLESNFKRQEEIFSRKLLSKEDYERGKFDLEQARVRWQRAQLDLDHASVRSPISGVVAERMVKLGDRIGPATKLYVLVNMKSLISRAHIPGTELPNISVGQPARITTNILPDLDFPGRIIRISPVVDPNSGTFRVTLAIDDAERKLRPGLFVKTNIVTATHDQAMLVPKRAVVYDDGYPHVFVVQDSTARKIQLDLVLKTHKTGKSSAAYRRRQHRGRGPERPQGPGQGAGDRRQGSAHSCQTGYHRAGTAGIPGLGPGTITTRRPLVDAADSGPGRNGRRYDFTKSLSSTREQISRTFEITTRRPVAIFMVVLAVAVFGYISYQQLPLTLMPDIAYPTLTIRTDYPDTAPEEVENLISRQIEQRLGVVNNLASIVSISRAGMSDVILEFGWDTDMNDAVQTVRENLDRLNMPRGVNKPLILRYDPTQDPIMRIGLYGDADLYALRLIAEEEIKQALEAMKGVAAARVHGAWKRKSAWKSTNGNSP